MGWGGGKVGRFEGEGVGESGGKGERGVDGEGGRV